jgi:hypothetical protein
VAYLPGTEQGVIAPRSTRPVRPNRKRSPVVVCPQPSRVVIAKQNVPTWPNSTFIFFPMPIAWTPADPHAFNAFASGGRDYLRIRNTNASQVLSVLIHSVPEPQFNRLGDRLVQVPPQSDVEFGPVPKIGYLQPDGNIWIDAPSSDIWFAVTTYS